MDDSIPAGPLSMRVLIQISAEGIAPEKLKAIVQWAEALSPFADAVRRAVPFKLEIEIQV